MIDQATQLRSLVERAAGEFAARVGPAPRLLVVASGTFDVGATTVAVNLAVLLAQLGQRLVLVDGDLRRPSLAARCGVTATPSVVDVLTARRDIHEVLAAGPSGIHVAPGAVAPQPTGGVYAAAAVHRLVGQMRALGRHAEMVIVDAGAGVTPVSRGCWEAAEQVVLVTTPATESLLEAYATLKMLTGGGAAGPNVALVMNQAADGPNAAAAYERFQSSCLKFLGREVPLLGWVPSDEQFGECAQPLVCVAPTCAAARALERIAGALLAQAAPQRRAG